MAAAVLAALLAALLVVPLGPALASQVAEAAVEPVLVAGIPLDFILFAATLAGVALFHHQTLQVALTGLAVIVLYKVLVTGFAHGAGLTGLAIHLGHEWVTLANLFCLLMGFALLARHFEESKFPDLMPAILPDDWTGAFALLALVFVLSAFLDNIAAALIGGTVAREVFRGKIHIGYLAAIVAASNAGGSGSVVGDTTTTMMWIDGVDPRDVLHAYIAAVIALVAFGIPASLLQQKVSPIMRNPPSGLKIDWTRFGLVGVILVSAIGANVTANLFFPDWLERLPILGLAVWTAILVTGLVRRPDFKVLPETFRGTLFLLSLVTAASMMPVDRLPEASWHSALGLGFVSAVFDNIPLTALALKQGGYDWGVLAFAVGYGGSMVWFGSSAGVALTNLFPEAKSVGQWVRGGWFVAVGYVVGFAGLMLLYGWFPHAPHH
ncbi:MAG: citrate transporter [Hyphomicrobiaceae bacterium]